MSIEKSQLDIFNMALRLVGATTVSSVDGQNKNARVCVEFYDIMRDTCLREYSWKSAKERAQLSPDTEKPVTEWNNAFRLPSDPWCLRVLQMESPDMQFEVEGRRLLTNEGTAKIVYIKRVENLGELDPYVIDLMAYKLASYIAVPIIGSKGSKRESELLKIINDIILPNAKKADGYEAQKRDGIQSNAHDYITARRTSGLPVSLQ
jgi:hypothetical protein